MPDTSPATFPLDRSAASPPPPAGQDVLPAASERKRVTVLFSDLSGYSKLCERLDPEDVREMMNLVFKEIVGIIVRYEGYIDRIIGDEVLAVFGIPRTHEDDPVRAIRAALDIHSAVPAMTQRFKQRLSEPLAMHSGIATGLVVTGTTGMKRVRHSLTGDTVNRASILTDLAAAGEILVGADTMAATSGFFEFERHAVRKKDQDREMGTVYRVLKVLERPEKIRRVRGLQARLVGRRGPMSRLQRHTAKRIESGLATCELIIREKTRRRILKGEFRSRLITCGLVVARAPNLNGSS